MKLAPQFDFKTNLDLKEMIFDLERINAALFEALNEKNPSKERKDLIHLLERSVKERNQFEYQLIHANALIEHQIDENQLLRHIVTKIYVLEPKTPV